MAYLCNGFDSHGFRQKTAKPWHATKERIKPALMGKQITQKTYDAIKQPLTPLLQPARSVGH